MQFEQCPFSPIQKINFITSI